MSDPKAEASSEIAVRHEKLKSNYAGNGGGLVSQMFIDASGRLIAQCVDGRKFEIEAKAL
jgi:hypothetical protein